MYILSTFAQQPQSSSYAGGLCLISGAKDSFSSGWFVPLLAANEAALKNSDITLEEALAKGSINQNLARLERN